MSEAITEEAITETNVREPWACPVASHSLRGGFHLFGNEISLCQERFARHGCAAWGNRGKMMLKTYEIFGRRVRQGMATSLIRNTRRNSRCRSVN